MISHRAEEPVGPAVDGQAGNILRTYREHQMSAGPAFLQRLWPRVKASLEYLIRHDPNSDGLLEGAQHNTLDAEWFGKVPWLSSLYIAALTAGKAMARELGDESFARQCRALAELGSKNLVDQLWSELYGYFIQRADPATSALGTSKVILTSRSSNITWQPKACGTSRFRSSDNAGPFCKASAPSLNSPRLVARSYRASIAAMTCSIPSTAPARCGSRSSSSPMASRWPSAFRERTCSRSLNTTAQDLNGFFAKGLEIPGERSNSRLCSYV